MNRGDALYRDGMLRSEFGHTGLCILASATLLEVLERLGINAQPLRVEATVYPSPAQEGGSHYPCALGSNGDGTRRPAAKPGMWAGHLVVWTHDRRLLDATLDQVNSEHPWLEARPFVHQSPAGLRIAWFGLDREADSWQALESWQTPWPDTRVRYGTFPGRGGFKGAPDFRPSHRRELVERVLHQLSHPA
jgi:hypothetical protein